MDNIVRLTGDDVIRLAERLTRAMNDGTTVRVMTGTDANGAYVKWTDSGGMWSPPHYGMEF